VAVVKRWTSRIRTRRQIAPRISRRHPAVDQVVAGRAPNASSKMQLEVVRSKPYPFITLEFCVLLTFRMPPLSMYTLQFSRHLAPSPSQRKLIL
jgi:hypothetical protein